jgi:branched-chain amino acid transport system ATP-binding protein
LENHLLEVKGVDVFYGDVQAVWDVSLKVSKGSIVALVGANGAGKSTLLQTIAGINRVKRGDITFSGSSIAGLRPQEVVGKGISMVPEGRHLFANLSVLENLKLGAYLRDARAHLKDSLERTYALFPVLKNRSSQKAGSLSGGEQQMLAIARAMMSRPTILMLDEPSLGLSPILVRTMFDLIGTLHSQDITILLVEQNIFQALKIADEAYVLKTGKIVMEGKGSDLLADPEIQKAYIGERWRKR